MNTDLPANAQNTPIGEGCRTRGYQCLIEGIPAEEYSLLTWGLVQSVLGLPADAQNHTYRGVIGFVNTGASLRGFPQKARHTNLRF